MLVFEDDLALMAEKVEDLRIIIESFYKVCLKRGLRLNVAKSRVMVGGDENKTVYNVEV